MTDREALDEYGRIVANRERVLDNAIEAEFTDAELDELQGLLESTQRSVWGLTGFDLVKRGRPMKAATIAMREAITALPAVHDSMTVRGVFYALVGLGVVNKTEGDYTKVQRQVLRLRREGLLPWTFIADGTRWARKAQTFDSVSEALDDIARLYRRDLWRSQGVRVEVWLEKDALAELVWPVADRWGVPLMVSRGVPSATFLRNAGQVAEAAYDADGQQTIVLCLYDHDAGGLRAYKSVLRGMVEHAPEALPDVRRVALTEEQVYDWKLPTRPAKRSDPQAKTWGDRPAVELDAVDPDQLRALVDDAIAGEVDQHAWQVAQTYEREEREGLQALIEGLGEAAS